MKFKRPLLSSEINRLAKSIVGGTPQHETKLSSEPLALVFLGISTSEFFNLGATGRLRGEKRDSKTYR